MELEQENEEPKGEEKVLPDWYCCVISALSGLLSLRVLFTSSLEIHSPPPQALDSGWFIVNSFLSS